MLGLKNCSADEIARIKTVIGESSVVDDVDLIIGKEHFSKFMLAKGCRIHYRTVVVLGDLHLDCIDPCNSEEYPVFQATNLFIIGHFHISKVYPKSTNAIVFPTRESFAAALAKSRAATDKTPNCFGG